MALHKVTNLTEARSLELRLEMFNVFNNAQFDGGNSVDGNIGNQGSTLVSSTKQPIRASIRSQRSSGFSGMRETNSLPHPKCRVSATERNDLI